MDKNLTKWDKRFLDLAEYVSQWSKDPSTKVGAVLVNPNRIVVGMGYNGFPRGVDDDPERYADRELKYKLVVHAEANAILNTNGPTDNCILYCWPLFPCSECAKLIIQKGISKVIAPLPSIQRWRTSHDIAEQMFLEAKVDIYYV